MDNIVKISEAPTRSADVKNGREAIFLKEFFKVCNLLTDNRFVYILYVTTLRKKEIALYTDSLPSVALSVK